MDNPGVRHEYPALPPISLAMIEQEVDMLLAMQYVSPTKPLVFIADPACGDFAWPDIAAIPEPNGLYRLSNHHNNSIFHFVEDRLYQLLRIVRRQVVAGQDAMVAKVHGALVALTHAKRVEWKQQRSDRGIGPPFVNTGKSRQP